MALPHNIPLPPEAAAAPAHALLQFSELRIPKELLELIPEFNGETKLLNLFLRKCEYIIEKYHGTVERNEFLMQYITSKLKGKAAALVSERGDYQTYTELKCLLVQHFGDPRSEECVALELESLKIKPNESYLEFCGRIQDTRAILLSKVNQSTSATLREAKRVIYNNTALNIFLYNLPEHMVRIVRLKNPDNLEVALEIVLEELNFQEQYNLRSKLLQNSRPQHSTSQPHAPGFLHNTFKQPAFQNQFRFGIPNQNLPRPNLPNPQLGLRPQFGYRAPVQWGYKPPAPAGLKPIQPQQFGF